MNAFEEATITTRRLVLTPLRPADADTMVDVLGDEQLHEFIGGHPATRADLRRRYGQLAAGSPDPEQICSTGYVITANIHPDHHASARVAARAGLTATAEEVDGERAWRRVAD